MENKEKNKIHGEEKSEKKEKGLSRRDFFKYSGATAGLAGMAAVAKSSPAYAGEKADSALVNCAVKEVDKPPYFMKPFEGAEKLKRVSQEIEPFYDPKMTKEKELEGNLGIMALDMSVAEKAKANAPGHSRLDQALLQAGWTSYYSNLFNWESMGPAKTFQGFDKWEGSPEDNNNYIKKAAHVFGAGTTGVAEAKEQWYYGEAGMEIDFNIRPLVFSGKHKKPEIGKDAIYIPKSMNRVIVMLLPLEGAMMEYSPSGLTSAEVSNGYSRMTETASKMSEFIRCLGYNAIPTVDQLSLIIPQAIDAGLGELGRHGQLINPELGSCFRITTVLTDMPISVDKPIKFGVAEFCRTCMKCAESCPSKSISFDKEPSYDIKCPSNNPGMKKWYVNGWSCFKFWIENGSDCANCIAACPYNKPQTWIHDVVKGVSAKTSAFNSTFRVLDDALGYGKTDDNTTKWWNSEGRPEKWPKYK